MPEHWDIRKVRLYEGDAYDLPFAAAELDAVYLVTVLPEIPDQAHWRRSGGCLSPAVRWR